MQIASLPLPIIANALPQEVVAKAVPNLQAAPPLIHRAVDPSPKSEKFKDAGDRKNQSGKRREGHDHDAKTKDDDDGHQVNISV